MQLKTRTLSYVAMPFISKQGCELQIMLVKCGVGLLYCNEMYNYGMQSL